MQKFCHGSGRGKTRKPILGMKHTALLGLFLTARNRLRLYSGTDRGRPGPDRDVCFITGLGHVGQYLHGSVMALVGARSGNLY